MKLRRESTTALVQEVGQHCLGVSLNSPFLDFELCILLPSSSTSRLKRVVFCSGGTTRRRPPTFCCCQRSRGANLCVCDPSQRSVRTPARPSVQEFRSLLASLVPLVLTAASSFSGFPSTRVIQCFVASCLHVSPSQTREALHFSEDEDIVIVRSLDFVSEYIDECPWLRAAQETPKGVRSQPNGSNNKDVARGRCVFLLSSAASQSSSSRKMAESLAKASAITTSL